MNGKKECKLFQKEKFQTLSTKIIYSTSLNYSISIEKNICVAMQSGIVV